MLAATTMCLSSLQPQGTYLSIMTSTLPIPPPSKPTPPPPPTRPMIVTPKQPPPRHPQLIQHQHKQISPCLLPHPVLHAPRRSSPTNQPNPRHHSTNHHPPQVLTAGELSQKQNPGFGEGEMPVVACLVQEQVCATAADGLEATIADGGG